MLLIQKKYREKQKNLGSISNTRVQTWADCLSNDKVLKIDNGAIREGNAEKKHQGFEGGNWQGQKLSGELRYHDNFYNRTYLPDKVKDVRGTGLGSHLMKKGDYNGPGDNHPGSQKQADKFQRLMRKRIKSNDQQGEFKVPLFAYKNDYQIAPPTQGQNLQHKSYHQHFNQSHAHFKKYYEIENQIKYKNNRTDRIESKHSSQLSMIDKKNDQRSPLTIRDPTQLDTNMKSKSVKSITSPVRKTSLKSQAERSTPNMVLLSK